MHDVGFPRQLERTLHHVLHEGVRAVHRAALHGGVAAVPELVRVVLDAPVQARLAHEIGPHFAGDDLVDAAAACGHHGAVEVADHRLAHRIEAAVAAAQAHAGGDHQVLERVGLVGDLPRMPDRRRVAGGAQHDLGALVGALARHLGEHAVVADDQCELAALRPVDHRDAAVPRLPGLDRHPGVELAVVERERAGVVDHDAGVVRVAVRVEFHQRKAAPDLVLAARGLERRDLGAVHAAHQLRCDAHRQAVQRVLGEHDEVEPGVVAPCLAHHRDEALGLRLQLCRCLDHRQLQLHQADHHAVRRFIQSTQSAHSLLLFNVPKTTRPGCLRPPCRAGS